jgi:hypothetical protein
MATENQSIEDWENLYDQLRSLLMQFGTEDFRDFADCWVDDDDIGTKQQKVYVRNLGLLRPPVVKSLQCLLTGEFADWEIMMAVAVPGPGDAWPNMGLTIRRHEIVDGLQRRYFPPEFRDLAYEGSRPGTDRD